MPTSHPSLTSLAAGARRGLRVVQPRAPVDDHELAVGLVRGEAWAATATWDKHAPMVFGFLGRAFGPDVEVEDLTQEVFLIVYAKIRELRDPGALSSFIFSIAVRTMKWELRRRRVRRIMQFRGFEDMPETPVAPLDAVSREALRRFYSVLDKLRANERAVFTMRHLQGMTLPEIADALGVSLATVKRRLERAARSVEQRVAGDPSLASYGKGAP